MGYTLLLNICTVCVTLFSSLLMACNTTYAAEGKHTDDVIVSKSNEPYLLDENMINIINKYSLNENAIDKTSYVDVSTNNVQTFNTIVNNYAPQYLDNGILSNSSVSMLEKILPSEYSIFDMPKRDNAPIHRLGTGVNMNKYPEYGNTAAGIANILLDVVFGTLTRNTLSMNINSINNNDSISLLITPVKGLALKIGFEDYTSKTDKSHFELKYKYSNTTNIKLKTSESPSEMKTGIEFELSF